MLVIGSQAIHASLGDEVLPEAERSIKVDVASLMDEHGSKADLIDGSIGELSMFHDTFGYYAQGVTAETAVLPEGWRERLVPYLAPATNGVTALCLEPHDLWLSKAVAGREKDEEYCAAALARALVDRATLRGRLDQMPGLNPALRQRVQAIIARDTSG